MREKGVVIEGGTHRKKGINRYATLYTQPKSPTGLLSRRIRLQISLASSLVSFSLYVSVLAVHLTHL